MNEHVIVACTCGPFSDMILFNIQHMIHFFSFWFGNANLSANIIGESNLLVIAGYLGYDWNKIWKLNIQPPSYIRNSIWSIQADKENISNRKWCQVMKTESLYEFMKNKKLFSGKREHHPHLSFILFNPAEFYHCQESSLCIEKLCQIMMGNETEIDSTNNINSNATFQSIY